MTEINKIENRCEVTDYQLQKIKEDVQNLTFPFCSEPVDVIICKSEQPFKNGLMVYVSNDDGYFGWEDSYEPVSNNSPLIQGLVDWFEQTPKEEVDAELERLEQFNEFGPEVVISKTDKEK